MSAEESSETVNDLTPGMRLRNAREQAGVSLQTISERTLISITKLQALERDEFATVGGTAHVTGFTKAYARALGLDAAALIKDVERAMGVEKSRIDAANMLATAQASSQLMWLYPALIAVLLVLVALWVGLWWFNGNGSEDSRTPAPTVQQDAPAPAMDTSRRNELSTSQSFAREVDDEVDEEPSGIGEVDGDYRTSRPKPEEGATVAPANEPGLTGDTEERPETVNSTVVPRTAPVTSQAQRSPLATEGTASPERTPAPTDALESEPYTQAPREATAGDEVTAGDDDALTSAPDELQFIFIEDCWLKITDATGDTIVEELAKAGQTRTVTGTAPFRVLLGDATAVALILLNDESVPFASRPGRPVLRMTIGQ